MLVLVVALVLVLVAALFLLVADQNRNGHDNGGLVPGAVIRG